MSTPPTSAAKASIAAPARRSITRVSQPSSLASVSGLMATAMVRAPSRAKSSALARPIPCPAAVTMAVFPARRGMAFPFEVSGRGGGVGADQACGAQIRPEGGGNRLFGQRDRLHDARGAVHAGDHRGDLRMGERELQRGGGERHAMGIAPRLDRGDPPDDLGSGGLIFVLERARPLPPTCPDDAFVWAAESEAGP